MAQRRRTSYGLKLRMPCRRKIALAYLFSTVWACGGDAAAGEAPGASAHRAARVESDGAALPQASDGGDDASSDAGADHESFRAVSAIISRSCAYTRCHSGVPTGAALPLVGVDLGSVLIDVPSCQYPPMMRVVPGHPERSWLYLKLTATVRPRDDAYYDYILFEPDPAWDPDDRGCRDRTEDGTPLFGQRMPLTAPNMLPPEELETFRRWIAEGAPH